MVQKSITRAIPDFELVTVTLYKPWYGEGQLIDVAVTSEEGGSFSSVSLTIAEAAQLVTHLQDALKEATA